MKPIRTFMTTLVVTGLASIGYARPPAPVAAQPFSALAAGSAAGSTSQQDEQKPKEKTETKPADAGKPEKSAKSQAPDKSQAPEAQKPEKPAKPQATDKSQMPEAQKQEKPAKPQTTDRSQTQAQMPDDNHPKQNKNVARQDQRADTGHGGNGGRIPEKDFKAHFGHEHKFSARQVVTTTRIVPNQTQFVYTGYTFVFADPWPEEWAMSDDCYIDYIDGEYYLLDLDHPGVQIELTIVG
jgi:cytoskeletal protein RodZ